MAKQSNIAKKEFRYLDVYDQERKAFGKTKLGARIRAYMDMDGLQHPPIDSKAETITFVN